MYHLKIESKKSIGLANNFEISNKITNLSISDNASGFINTTISRDDYSPKIMMLNIIKASIINDFSTVRVRTEEDLTNYAACIISYIQEGSRISEFKAISDVVLLNEWQASHLIEAVKAKCEAEGIDKEDVAIMQIDNVGLNPAIKYIEDCKTFSFYTVSDMILNKPMDILLTDEQDLSVDTFNVYVSTCPRGKSIKDYIPREEEKEDGSRENP